MLRRLKFGVYSMVRPIVAAGLRLKLSDHVHDWAILMSRLEWIGSIASWRSFDGESLLLLFCRFWVECRTFSKRVFCEIGIGIQYETGSSLSFFPSWRDSVFDRFCGSSPERFERSSSVCFVRLDGRV